MLCCLPVSPPRKTDIEMVPDLEDVSAIERTRTGDAFDVLVKPGQYLLDLVNFPPPALRSGVRDDRAPVCHDRRVFDEDRIGVPLVGAQHGHLQATPLERADVVVVLLAGLLVIRPPQVRGCYPGVDRPGDGPDDGFAKHPRTLPQGDRTWSKGGSRAPNLPDLPENHRGPLSKEILRQPPSDLLGLLAFGLAAVHERPVR